MASLLVVSLLVVMVSWLGRFSELTVCVLGLLQGFLAVEGLGEARLVLITRGALAVRRVRPLTCCRRRYPACCVALAWSTLGVCR